MPVDLAAVIHYYRLTFWNTQLLHAAIVRQLPGHWTHLFRVTSTVSILFPPPTKRNFVKMLKHICIH